MHEGVFLCIILMIIWRMFKLKGCVCMCELAGLYYEKQKRLLTDWQNENEHKSSMICDTLLT